MYAWSGATGAELFEWHGTASLKAVGGVLAGLGDTDGDGFDDVGVGSGGNSGRLTVLGGPDGHEIWHQGIQPNVVVERASDVAALDPDEVSKIKAADIDHLTDPQLARGLSLVTAMTTAGG